MKLQAVFFLEKIKVKKLKCHLLQSLYGALRVSINFRVVGKQVKICLECKRMMLFYQYM